jgi:hypothetical protein
MYDKSFQLIDEYECNVNRRIFIWSTYIRGIHLHKFQDKPMNMLILLNQMFYLMI